MKCIFFLKGQSMETPFLCTLQGGRGHLSSGILQKQREEGEAFEENRPFQVCNKKKKLYVNTKEALQYNVNVFFFLRVSLIFSCPEKHQMWDTIQKMFKCPSASVLLLRVEDFIPKCPRDYFLIGENRFAMIF